MSISAVIITLNEEKNIEECLKSISFCDEIVVVDSGSTDATISIAKKYTPLVFHRPFDHFSTQKNKAISRAVSDWILSIDADERVLEPLKLEILDVVSYHSRYQAYRIPRKNFIFGNHLKYGANRNDAPIRLFRRGAAQFQGIIHERANINGEISKLESPLIHLSSPTLKDYLRRLEQYTQLEATQLYERGEKFSYIRFLTKPLFRFVQRYFLQCGFLDGKKGFIYCVLSGFYEFLRYAKLWELEEKRCDLQSKLR